MGWAPGKLTGCDNDFAQLVCQSGGNFLRATSGARNPNLNIGFKRMRGSYIALQ